MRRLKVLQLWNVIRLESYKITVSAQIIRRFHPRNIRRFAKRAQNWRCLPRKRVVTSFLQMRSLITLKQELQRIMEVKRWQVAVINGSKPFATDITKTIPRERNEGVSLEEMFETHLVSSSKAINLRLACFLRHREYLDSNDMFKSVFRLQRT